MFFKNTYNSSLVVSFVVWYLILLCLTIILLLFIKLKKLNAFSYFYRAESLILHTDLHAIYESKNFSFKTFQNNSINSITRP